MPSIRFDDSSWSILLVRYPTNCTQADIQVHLEHVNDYLSRNRAFGVAFDLRRARDLTGSEHSIFAEFLRSRYDQLRDHCFGTSVVSTSDIHHGALAALTWVTNVPFAVRTHTTVEEGITWLQRRFDAWKSPPEVPLHGLSGDTPRSGAAWFGT